MQGRFSPDPKLADIYRRGRLLYITLGFLGLDVPPEKRPSGLAGLHAWMDSWHGVGLIDRGLVRQDRDLVLERFETRWRATVYWKGRTHDTAQGNGWQETPWRAAQQATFRVLHAYGYGTDTPGVSALELLDRERRRSDPRSGPVGDAS